VADAAELVADQLVLGVGAAGLLAQLRGGQGGGEPDGDGEAGDGVLLDAHLGDASATATPTSP
jgi:hypothetical protein